MNGNKTSLHESYFFSRSCSLFSRFFLVFMNTKQNVTAWAPRNSIKQILRTQPGQKNRKTSLIFDSVSSYQYVRKHRIFVDLGWIQSENITKKVATKLASIDHLNSFAIPEAPRKKKTRPGERREKMIDGINEFNRKVKCLLMKLLFQRVKIVNCAYLTFARVGEKFMGNEILFLLILSVYIA